MGEKWRRMVKKRAQAYHLQRRVCFYCKFSLKKEDTVADHWFPKALGGKNFRFNIVAACKACNKYKRDMTAEEFFLSDRLQIIKRLRGVSARQMGETSDGQAITADRETSNPGNDPEKGNAGRMGQNTKPKPGGSKTCLRRPASRL